MLHQNKNYTETDCLNVYAVLDSHLSKVDRRHMNM